MIIYKFLQVKNAFKKTIEIYIYNTFVCSGTTPGSALAINTGSPDSLLLLVDNPDSPTGQLSPLLSSTSLSLLNSSRQNQQQQLLYSNGGGKPTSSIRRGPGRPRKDFISGIKLYKDGRSMKRFRGGGAGSVSSNGGGNNTTGLGGGNTKKRVVNRDELFQISLSQDGGGGGSFGSSMLLPSPNDEYSSSSLGMSSSFDNEFGNGGGGVSGGGGDKVMQPPEEPIYFLEKYPGKLCALCNLGERSQLGQGEMLRIESKDGSAGGGVVATPQSSPVEGGKDSACSTPDEKSPRGSTLGAPLLSNRRLKGLNKCKYVLFLFDNNKYF